MKSERYFFIHTPSNWDKKDVESIRSSLEEFGFSKNEKAAIGEGVGGAGFETIIELLIVGISSSVLANLLYDITKTLIFKKPKKKDLPPNLPKEVGSYRLVVHYFKEKNDTIIGLDLNSKLEDIEISLKDLEVKLRKRPWRIYQNGKKLETIE
jgi:hypothetical protein